MGNQERLGRGTVISAATLVSAYIYGAGKGRSRRVAEASLP